MKAIILAAGRGTRLAPLTDHTPKPLLPVQGKPLIEWQIERLVEAGIVNIAINLHHLGDQIESHLGDGSEWGAALTYSRETELLETGGAMVKLLPYFEHAPFVVIASVGPEGMDCSPRGDAPGFVRVLDRKGGDIIVRVGEPIPVEGLKGNPGRKVMAAKVEDALRALGVE